MGKGGHSTIGTLVERPIRHVVVLHLPDGRTAEHVRRALTASSLIDLDKRWGG